MMVFITYLLITLLSITTFGILLNRVNLVHEQGQSIQYQLQSDLRNDLLLGWPIVSLQPRPEVKSKWIKVAHDIQIGNFHRSAFPNSGNETIELIYSWLATRIMVDDIPIDFSYSKTFENVAIALDTQKVMLSTVSNVLCSTPDLSSIRLNYRNDKKLLEIHFILTNFSESKTIAEKLKKEIAAMGGKWLSNKGLLSIYIPN